MGVGYGSFVSQCGKMNKNALHMMLRIMRVSPFRIGLVLVVAGAIWAGMIFAGAERQHVEGEMTHSDSLEMDVRLAGSGIGYLVVHVLDFSAQDELFVSVLDQDGNVIREEIFKTRMAVQYFEGDDYTQYTVRITNISGHTIGVQAESGDTAAHAMMPAGLLILVGSLSMMLASYIRLYNYSMTQPDEKIS